MKRIAAALLITIAACGGQNSDPLQNFLPGATVVKSEPACLDCSLGLNLVSDLAEEKDKDVLTGHLRSLISTSQGIVVTSIIPGPPLLFGDDGRFKRALGAAGPNAPNHFVNTSLLRHGVHDTILVFDESARTITLLDLPLNPVRTIPFDGRIRDMTLMPDASLLVVTPIAAGDSIMPLARVALVNGASEPLGMAAIRTLDGADDEYSNRVVTAARDGAHFWSAHKLRYAIEKRKLNGELVQILERDADWFRPAKSVAGITPDAPPTAQVMGIWEDPRGLLWVHTVTADGRWHSALGGINGVDGKMRYVVTGPDLYKDTRIEVIDPSNGKLVATAKFDPEYPTFASGGYLARVLKGPMGWLVSEVWLVRLRGFSTR